MTMMDDPGTGAVRTRRTGRGGRARGRARRSRSGAARRPGPDAVPDVALTVPSRRPLARLRLRPADRALVAAGEVVASGQPLVEQCRETYLLEVPARGPIAALVPGR